MKAGPRDTLIIFEHRTTTVDPVYKTKVEGPWSEYGRAMAEVLDVLPSRSEGIDQNVSMERRPARIRFDYFDGIGVTAAMRIDIDGRKLRIVSGPAMKGHRNEWELVAEELSTSGQEP